MLGGSLSEVTRSSLSAPSLFSGDANRRLRLVGVFIVELWDFFLSDFAFLVFFGLMVSSFFSSCISSEVPEITASICFSTE